jgi:hypothetical protein
MKSKIAPFVLGLVFAGTGVAQDDREAEIFGSPEGSPTGEAAPSADATQTSNRSSLIDSMQIGGRLEMRAASAQQEQQKFPESSYSQLKRADIYFDTRPNPDIRAMLRMRLSEQTPANPLIGTSAGTLTEIDEFWLKWDVSDAVYFTLGKQHLKWGSGRMWNPTDFTAREIRDPFALFDSRLGQELFKIHYPVEKQGFNYYGILMFDDMARNDDIGAALRGEFTFGGVGEFALSFQTRQDRPVRYGADVSSGVGPVDLYVESAISTRQNRDFYEGSIDSVAGTLPTAVSRKDETFSQVVGGIQYSMNYSDEDSLTVGGEYFWNGLGYDKRELELYSLIRGTSQSLYAGRQYAGVYLRLPSPGSWNDTSFFVNGIQNLSDKTSVARVTMTWLLYKEATFELFAGKCFGDAGELCFRLPAEYQSLATNPDLPVDVRAVIAALPTKRTTATTGVAVSINF